MEKSLISNIYRIELDFDGQDDKEIKYLQENYSRKELLNCWLLLRNESIDGPATFYSVYAAMNHLADAANAKEVLNFSTSLDEAKIIINTILHNEDYTKDMLKTWTNLVNNAEEKQINYEWKDCDFKPFIKSRINKDNSHKIDLMTEDGKIFIGCYPTGIVENNNHTERNFK